MLCKWIPGCLDAIQVFSSVSSLHKADSIATPAILHNTHRHRQHLKYYSRSDFFKKVPPLKTASLLWRITCFPNKCMFPSQRNCSPKHCLLTFMSFHIHTVFCVTQKNRMIHSNLICTCVHSNLVCFGPPCITFIMIFW